LPSDALSARGAPADLAGAPAFACAFACAKHLPFAPRLWCTNTNEIAPSQKGHNTNHESPATQGRARHTHRDQHCAVRLCLIQAKIPTSHLGVVAAVIPYMAVAIFALLLYGLATVIGWPISWLGGPELLGKWRTTTETIVGGVCFIGMVVSIVGGPL